jgi:hypothetical protein
MTAKPQSPVAGPVVAGVTTFASQGQCPSTEKSAGGDFSSLISQALSKQPGKYSINGKDPKTTPAGNKSQTTTGQPTKSGQGVNGTVSDKQVSQTEASGDDNSDAQVKASAGASVKPANEVDASVSSMVLALLAQSMTLPEKAAKTAAAQKTELQIEPKSPGNLNGSLLNGVAAASGGEGSIAQGAEARIALSGSGLPVLSLKGFAAASAGEISLKADLKKGAEAALGVEAAISPSEQGAAVGKAVGQAPPLQQIVAEESGILGNGVNPSISQDGIGAASNKQRMKFVNEKNEIAGRTMQKLPHAPESDDVSTGLAENAVIKTDFGASGQKNDSSWSMAVLDSMAKAAALPAGHIEASDSISKVDSQAQVDRVARLVNQEVVTIRQSGASAMTVSLKVDSQTELSLQLTNHDGQIQASIRCERGSVAGMDSHWGQLQESLAKQNVQLLPLESKGSATNSPFNSPSQNSFSGHSDQPSQNYQRQTPQLSGELAMEDIGKKPARSRNTKTNKSSPQGWESWA